MNIQELESFIDQFIEKNDLQDNLKNRNIIKMGLRSPSAKSLKTTYEKSEYLKKKFLK
ncbi:hypothetical protein [Thiospirochaeta perfilievii]|uniref:hypothetical protein n=1 Tax=Thiospirochaeta perfilievii TaxID=252967 RepID=UPI001659EFD5|nr:hypothetical protein [Thiospirochaeta perfilievii]